METSAEIEYYQKILTDPKTREQIGTAVIVSSAGMFRVRIQLNNDTTQYKTFDLRRYVLEIDEKRPIMIDYAPLYVGPKTVACFDFWDGTTHRLDNLEYLEWKSGL